MVIVELIVAGNQTFGVLLCRLFCYIGVKFVLYSCIGFVYINFVGFIALVIWFWLLLVGITLGD